MPAQDIHNRSHFIPFRVRRLPSRLVACPVCLRVREGAAWTEAEEAIRRLRTFERDPVMRLGGGLCDRCETELQLRRRGHADELAA